MRRISFVLFVLVLLASACSWSRRAKRFVGASGARTGFTVHEWGLFAVDANDDASMQATTEVAGGLLLPESERPHGYGRGGKPVLYVHLDPGVSRQRIDVRLGLPSASLVERWPRPGLLAAEEQDAFAGWRGVDVRRGDCDEPTAPPTASSAECATPDGFCEAAEIPRYFGDRETCLHVGDAQSELLFYRAARLPTDRLPIRMVRSGDAWQATRVPGSSIEGPIFWIRAIGSGRFVHIRMLESSDFDHGPPRADAGRRVDPATASMVIRNEARRRGLTETEAYAFADAWAPAVFERCSRQGPEAAGTVPRAFEQSETSLLYFAPPDVVDATVPLETRPAARATNRVFLVRYSDGGATISREEAARASAELASHAWRPPTMRLAGSPTITGEGLDTSQVRRVVQRHAASLQECYEAAWLRSPALEGRVVLTLAIDAEGVVRSASTDDAIGDPILRECIAAAARPWTFPPHDPAGNVTATIPLVLTVHSSD